MYFVAVFSLNKSLTLLVINGINERVTHRFGYLNLHPDQKLIDFNFLKMKKRLKIL